jgi:glycine/D-amino acid oxidase-like deaminating enzyme
MTASVPSISLSDQSWWFEEALRAEGNRPAAPCLTGEHDVDVAIVGGGFTGLWTAIALRERRPDLSVALIEASTCGSGASGKNGGKVHGYWAALSTAVNALGEDGALAIAKAGSRAQDGIRTFAAACVRDVWWNEGPNILVSTSPSQDKKIDAAVALARRLGVSDQVTALSQAEVQGYCASPAFRGGLIYPESATVQPARLARALREAAMASGCRIFENTPMASLDPGTPNRIGTPQGSLLAREVVLATNAALAERRDVRPYVSVFSSYAVLTEPSGEKLSSAGWNGAQSFADLRMFLHYFRRTPDGRVLMGSGSGPIACCANWRSAAMTRDARTAERAERGLRHLVPAFADVPLTRAWGGAIDVASDRLPMFRTVDGTHIHFGCGYSGHGVNATYIGGQCLASLVLGSKDEWTSLPFCTRTPPRLPPEPFRYLGGNAVRWAILRSEECEEVGDRVPLAARAIAKLPKLMGLKIGVR